MQVEYPNLYTVHYVYKSPTPSRGLNIKTTSYPELGPSSFGSPKRELGQGYMVLVDGIEGAKVDSNASLSLPSQKSGVSGC